MRCLTLSDGLTLGEKLKYLMETNGITRKELAAKTGISDRSIYRYIRGSSYPNECIIESLAKALHTSSEYLSGGIDKNYSAADDFFDAKNAIQRSAKSWDEKMKNELIKALISKK